MTLISQHFCWEMEAIATDISGFDLSGTLGWHERGVGSRSRAWNKKQQQEFTPTAKPTDETCSAPPKGAQQSLRGNTCRGKSLLNHEWVCYLHGWLRDRQISREQMLPQRETSVSPSQARSWWWATAFQLPSLTELTTADFGFLSRSHHLSGLLEPWNRLQY